jgi:outer membrane protein assembly factor BamB
MQKTLCKLCSAVVITLTASAYAADWPQFMGPTEDAVSPEKNLAKTFPAEGPKVLWTVKMGKGYGGPAVRAGKVYVLDRPDQQQDALRCLDLATGNELWKFAYDAPGRVDHDGSRSTPAVTDKRVYSIGMFGDFYCLDLGTHEVVWKKNLLKDYNVAKPTWAVAQSPILYKNLVIAAPQSSTIGIVAYDQETGKEVWHSGPVGQIAYVTPKLVTIDGVDQFVMVAGNGTYGISAADGKQLWKYGYSCRVAIPNVSVLGNGKFFATGGYSAGSAIFQVSKEGDNWTTKEIARINAIGSQCHQGLVFEKNIYVICNPNERQDGMVCFDFEGKKLWQTSKTPGPWFDKGGSILTGDGLIYAVDGDSGELHIVQPSPEGFKSLAKGKVLAGQQIWGTLALADGKLVIRDQSQMKCVDVSGK